MPKPDLSDFEAVERTSGGGVRLKVDVILERLTADRRSSLEAALRGDYRPSVVAKVVTGWGHAVSAAAVKTWRAKNCP